MRSVALMLALWLTLGVAARAEMPFTWVGGKTKSAKGAGAHVPTAVTKMAGAPKRLVQGTKSMFTPKKPAKNTNKLGTVAVHKLHPEPEQPGFFDRLFGTQPQDSSPATMGEWMSMKQVKPFGGSKPIR